MKDPIEREKGRRASLVNARFPDAALGLLL